MLKTIIGTTLILVLTAYSVSGNPPMIPDGSNPEPIGWWQVAGVPDLGNYNHDGMQPVDFAIWQAADGTWQLVSCIRQCGTDGKQRVLHRWEGNDLFDTNWEPKGVFMVSDPKVGEQEGWIQAPYVVKKDGLYHFFYGGGGQICLAVGTDGKAFSRVLQADGRTRVFECDEYDRARDIMIIKDNGKYYGYYTGSMINKWPDDTRGAIFCRTSLDLKIWGEEIKISETMEKGIQFFSAECPQVIKHGEDFYLFKTLEYKPGSQKTKVYRSRDPLNFGIGSERLQVSELPVAAPEFIRYRDEWFLASLMPDLKGIRIRAFSMDSLLTEK